MPWFAPRDRRARTPSPALGALTLEHLTLGYDEHPAVHHLSLHIPAGSLVALVGPNGAGKSTLLKALAGELRPIEGQVSGLDGLRVAYHPQHHGLDMGFPIQVQDLVAMGLWHEVGALGRIGTAHWQRCHAALAAVGLQGFERRGIDTLSGGQLQRALFARLMLQDAPIVLLDEPFAAVDARTTEVLMGLLQGWHRQGKTVLVSLHNLALAASAFPHTLLLARELVAFGPSTDTLTPANWQCALDMHEPFEDEAEPCEPHVLPAAPHAHGHDGHAHPHPHPHSHLHSHSHAHAPGHTHSPSLDLPR